MSAENPIPLVPGRECGACNACCRYPTINDPALRKPPNILCAHWQDGCTIYGTRPTACRTFFCGWRILSQLSDDWRPDRSGILLRFEAAQTEKLAVHINILRPLTESTTRALLGYIGSRVDGGYPTFLAVPGPPGHAAAAVLLNNRMAAAVQSRDFPATLSAFNEALRACREFPTQPVVMDRGAAPDNS